MMDIIGMILSQNAVNSTKPTDIWLADYGIDVLSMAQAALNAGGVAHIPPSNTDGEFFLAIEKAKGNVRFLVKTSATGVAAPTMVAFFDDGSVTEVGFTFATIMSDMYCECKITFRGSKSRMECFIVATATPFT